MIQRPLLAHAEGIAEIALELVLVIPICILGSLAALTAIICTRNRSRPRTIIVASLIAIAGSAAMLLYFMVLGKMQLLHPAVLALPGFTGFVCLYLLDRRNRMQP